MSFLPSPARSEAEVPPPRILASTAAEAISEPPLAVSADSDIADRELDAAIRELGQASERAMADGDPAGARIYADRMMAAIRSRTPEHQARLTAEADKRIDEGVCYFSSDAAQALGRGRIG